MFGTTTISRTALALAASFGLALAGAASASADGGPVLGAGGGCALQCIQKALVTTISTASKVELRTSVPTKIVITARRLSATGGLVAGPPDADATGQTLRTERTLFLVGLKPKTTYRITVSATDGQGHTASRSGTFETSPVATAIDLGGPGGLSWAWLLRAVREEGRPDRDRPDGGRLQIQDRLAGPHPADRRPRSACSAWSASTQSAGLSTSWTTGANWLDPGTVYFVLVERPTPTAAWPRSRARSGRPSGTCA